METKETTGKYFVVDTINISPLQRAGGNIRTDYGEKDGTLLELVESIRSNGIKEPMKGYRDSENEGKWIAINGHTRLKACEILRNEGIEVKAKVILVDARKVSDEELIYDMITSNAGRPLKPIEMAEAVRRLIAKGVDVAEISQRFGKTKDFIRNLELLAMSPKRVRDLVSDGRIAYSLVLEALKKCKDFNEAVELIEKAAGLAQAPKQIKTEGFEHEESPSESDGQNNRIKRSHLYEAMNRVDSFKELQSVFKSQIDNQKPVVNQELFLFAKKLIENKLVKSDIEKLLF